MSDAPDAPGHWDRAVAVDAAGVTNVVSIAYWTDPAARLRLHHEVTVARAGDQRSEYVNGHAGTGMLRGARV